ncbi:homeobox protein CDX-1-like isoform X2 [Macrosteles quadrilineatus]|uniref:homeobox protein CDX-1-like isoform X2 n=1 Tax=Macrosteles quadrilineatus TaxID=74068 RepID=UPI0023E2E2A5|nr:homeobox protein CDX-1-like isoform X2 [Macrosteles quadrilineatus]
MSGDMVYYNPLMYRGQQSPVVPQGYTGWYPPGYHQPQQQFLSCMHDAGEQQWSHHHFSPGDWSVEPESILPSPSVTVQSTSGGSELSSPGLPQNPRPPPARSPYEWMRKPSYQSQPNPGKTRTKDKYRVVYTDHQRLELEKEFHYSRYITIRRKAELATNLGLSERQVKIWFQNRRAKERKQLKKREELIHKEKMQQLAML